MSCCVELHASHGEHPDSHPGPTPWAGAQRPRGPREPIVAALPRRPSRASPTPQWQLSTMGTRWRRRARLLFGKASMNSLRRGVDP
eukprot:366249-Chlamydomonas_euryale.AAC.4